MAALDPLTRAAALDGGAAAAIGYGVALWVLRVGSNVRVPIAVWRYVAVMGALLVALTALAAAADRVAPPRANRPGAELLASVVLGSTAFFVAMSISQIVVTGSVDLFTAAVAVLGAGLTATGWLCRIVVEQRGRVAVRVALVVALVSIGAVLASANHDYTWCMIQGQGAERAASSALSNVQLSSPAWLVRVVAPASLALALPTLVRALDGGLPAQVMVGMTGTAAAQRALDLPGFDIHTLRTPLDVEVLASCLVPVACALVAPWTRRPRPTDA